MMGIFPDENISKWKLANSTKQIFFFLESQVLSIYQHTTGSKPGVLHPLAWYKELRLFNGKQEENRLRSPKYIWKHS